ncbi:MAG: class I SAM-dependent methyltransferase [Betaproteobacteria bacterium]|nr:class I SAM-dependent methyltransferase [Betaproteobacteria bacterium]
MREIDLLGSAVIRPVEDRLNLIRTAEGTSRQFENFTCYGYDYFDNPEFGVGYGGYHYDGRYKATVKRLCDEFCLKKGARILEVGCAKGFILYEFHVLGFEVVGVDASEYAIANAKEEVRDKLILNRSAELPFADNSFDFVLAKEVIPHLNEPDALRLITECVRVSDGNRIFFEIQCAESNRSSELMKTWDVTHMTIKPRSWWVKQLEELKYPGSFHCKELFPV